MHHLKRLYWNFAQKKGKMQEERSPDETGRLEELS